MPDDKNDITETLDMTEDIVDILPSENNESISAEVAELDNLELDEDQDETASREDNLILSIDDSTLHASEYEEYEDSEDYLETDSGRKYHDKTDSIFAKRIADLSDAVRNGDLTAEKELFLLQLHDLSDDFKVSLDMDMALTMGDIALELKEGDRDKLLGDLDKLQDILVDVITTTEEPPGKHNRGYIFLPPFLMTSI